MILYIRLLLYDVILMIVRRLLLYDIHFLSEPEFLANVLKTS